MVSPSIIITFAIIMKTSKIRMSNIELLRIISMMMVLIVHLDGASLGIPDLKGNFTIVHESVVWQLCVESFAIIGVNCFTLISGYCEIHLKWRNVGIYLFQCIFYSVGIYTVYTIFSPKEFSWAEWGESWMVLTHTDLWYVPAYFVLMLLSPFINAGFSQLNKRLVLIITFIFLIYNIWAGWWWNGKFNPNGYSVIQLILMYMIGRCLAMLDIHNNIKRNRVKNYSWILYIIFSFASVIYAFWSPLKAFAYNSPFVIASSITFFLFFSLIKCQSKLINYIAKSAFSVYLVHKSPLIWSNLIKSNIATLWHNTNLIQFSFLIIIITVGIYGLCMILDSLRRWISNLIFK